MDTAPTAAPPATGLVTDTSAPAGPAAPDDRLAAEVRESLLLLLLSLAVTVGLAGAASALLTLLA
jgi:hypothetical protein